LRRPPAGAIARTALQNGGFGVALQLAINGAGCAKPVRVETKASSAKPARIVSEVFMSGSAALQCGTLRVCRRSRL
jgi:hypothetical protein